MGNPASTTGIAIRTARSRASTPTRSSANCAEPMARTSRAELLIPRNSPTCLIGSTSGRCRSSYTTVARLAGR